MVSSEQEKSSCAFCVKILHSKWVCRLLPAVAEAYDIGGSVDLILSAAILHDNFKYAHHKIECSRRDHPLVEADYMRQVYKDKGGETGFRGPRARAYESIQPIFISAYRVKSHPQSSMQTSMFPDP
jgi:hypothetical protein